MLNKPKSITPNICLEKGTKVSILGGKKGEIIQSIITLDQFNMHIYVHKVNITDVYNRGNRKWVKIKPVIKRINYAGIFILT